MEPLVLVVIAVALLAYTLVSRHLADTPVTPPMLFIALGYLVGAGGLGLTGMKVDHAVVHVMAEVTLGLVLFVDAARIDLLALSRHHDLPVRMLVLGLPLTVVAGTLAGLAVLPGLSFWEVALLAAILTPTDAALAQAVMWNSRIPARIRQALNIESGLNDGIALPIVLLLGTCAAAAHGAEDAGTWIVFGLLQLGLSPLIGFAAGFCGGRAVDWAAQRGWIATSLEGLSGLAIAAASFALAELFHANGFIAVFVAGLGFGRAVGPRCRFLYEFMEAEGQFLVLVTFLIFGMVMAPLAIERLDLAVVAYAALSLTVVRMVPVGLSLVGTGVRPVTHLFLGWFGPRGLASMLFALLILDKVDIPGKGDILAISAAVVVLSAIAHGITAAPFARLYGNCAARMGECAETREVPEQRLRILPDLPKMGAE